MIIPDIRQSEKWAEYLEFLGWKSIRTSKGINIEIMPMKIGGAIVKIQRPRNISVKDLEDIENLCLKNSPTGKKPIFIKLEPQVGQDEKVLEKASYKATNSPLVPPSTIYIHLEKSESDLWNGISHGGKYSIKRAQREGARVEYFQNPKQEKLREFHEVLLKTGGKKGFHVQKLDDLLNKAEIFEDESFLITVYTKDGDLAGANFYLGYNENIWFMHGATTEAGRKGKEGYELVWKAFLYFKGLGYKVLDLEGKDDERFPDFTKGWGGFSHFKEKFGGEWVEFPQPRVKLFNPLLKLISKVAPLNL